MTLIALCISLAAACIAFRAWSRRAGARAVSNAATNILRNARILYSGAHEYREVSLAEFPHLDAAFYDAGRELLEGEGFAWLADVEDVTVTSAGGPMMPAAARVMAGDEGAIIAALYHARSARTGTGASFRIADFETPLRDGTFIVTSNAELAGRLASPPEVHAEFHAADTSIAALLLRHRSRVGEHARSHPDVAPLPTASLAHALQHQERLDAIKSRFRASRQGVYSAEELQRLAPPGTEAMAPKVVAALVSQDSRGRA